MKIEKKTVQSGILKLEKNVQITIDQDMNVPDTKPDVEKIVESRGEVHIDEGEIMTDRIRIRGMFFVQLPPRRGRAFKAFCKIIKDKFQKSG